MKVYTIGFTKKSAEKFFGLVGSSGCRRVVDVRLNNTSQIAGFAKRDDLQYFLNEICGVDYVHLPELAPTQEIIDDYRKRKKGWEHFEKAFLDLVKERRIENSVAKETIADGCLLCSEHEAAHCHRSLVLRYLGEHWGDIDVRHLG